LQAVLLLAGFGRDSVPAAFDQPDDCPDSAKRLHSAYVDRCEVPD